MDNRYFLAVACPTCGGVENDVYYAPAYGFTTHTCACGHVVDLVVCTDFSIAIDHERTSILADIKTITKAVNLLSNIPDDAFVAIFEDTWPSQPVKSDIIKVLYDHMLYYRNNANDH